VVRITLIDENGSGEDGAGQLTDMGDGTTKVELIMQNAPDGAVQPAHIHTGTCANLNPTPAYPLTNVVDGKSTTIVKVTLAELMGEKYAINVHKSATEAAVYISCGNLPLTATTSGPLTADQALTQLLSDATDLQATIKKHETDASLAAYDAYHTTFAANENTIKAKSASTQATLEDAMHAVQTALAAGDWTKTEDAAGKLVDAIKAAQTAMGGATSAMSTAMTQLQNAANDLIRETGNQDKDGAQEAYNEFHTLFAANEDAIKAANAEAQAHIEAAMHEVNDALTAGDWTKASAAAKELAQEISDAMGEMGMSTNTLPTTGNGSLLLALLLLAGGAGGLLVAGGALRRRAAR
jgi:hypothetical protein